MAPHLSSIISSLWSGTVPRLNDCRRRNSGHMCDIERTDPVPGVTLFRKIHTQHQGGRHRYDREYEMNWETIEGNWKQFTGKVKEEWSALTDDHIEKIAGERNQLSEKLQEFYGISKDAADAQIDAFADRIQDHPAD